ncbi:hypothetical protein [Sphingobium sp. SCG-1]|uniref:hypothetical protein n=1 Tax=Sphingobium sp. SCG-1 TaxID=2072936 RepID=UPI0021D527A4|nr:hypothetical protein [Sphingobium sp. SCG-1]
MLQALVEADGRILTHVALLERVWGKAVATTSNIFVSPCDRCGSRSSKTRHDPR